MSARRIQNKGEPANSTIFRSDEEISEAIACRKVFRGKPKGPAEVNRNIDQRFKVYAAASGTEYSVFITYSSLMPSDFSLGLMCGQYLLFRCNGFHGTTRAGYYSAEHHAYPHGHLLTMDDIQNGRGKKPSRILDFTGKFIDLRSATSFFFQFCGILDTENYFDLAQTSLFDPGGDLHDDH